jgi:SPP1 gp7 family putative phage head morphogenesis protein
VEKGRDEVYKLAATDDDDFANALAQMIKDVWEKQGMPYNLNEDVTSGFIDELFNGVQDGYGSTLVAVDFDTPDYNMLANLQRDVYHFSAAKNYQQLKALTGALIDDDGKLRSFSDFKKAAFDINDQHINQWLQTEYDTAIGSGQMASKWTDITSNTATKLLEFDAVMDERTSAICSSLNGTVKPVDDEFWNEYYPPNHFNCRSTVRQLNGGNETPSDKIVYPEKVPAMFKVNLAKRGLAFPPDHPYYDGAPQSVFDKAANMLKKDNAK